MRRTKILCTLGPSSSSEAKIKALKAAGMNGCRLNFSHGEAKEHEETAKLIREIRGGDALAIVLDLPGPKIRVGELPNKSVTLKEGETVKITSREVMGTGKLIPVNCPDVSVMAKVGDLVFFDDGKIELEVVGKEREVLEATVMVGGILLSRKGFNAPLTDLRSTCLSKRDLQGIELAKKIKPEFVAQSFVRNAADVMELRGKLPRGVAVISKIENAQALSNFPSIMHKADAIMVARGDLGMQTPIEDLPFTQKWIISECSKAAKPVITATQMLESMIELPTPRRAEVTDVANAVFDGTDCLMLSGETALGNDPVRVVKVMAKIAEAAERHPEFFLKFQPGEHDLTFSLATGASKLAADVRAKAIVTCTLTGKTAHMVARDKPRAPVIAVTDREKTFNQLALSWGVQPALIRSPQSPEALVENAIKAAEKMLSLKKGDLVVVTSGKLAADTTNLLRVETV